MHGPNVRRLIARKMSLLLVPPGTGGVAGAVAALADRDRLGRVAREAMAWVGGAVAAVRAAPDNPHGDDAEAIAAAILQRIEGR